MRSTNTIPFLALVTIAAFLNAVSAQAQRSATGVATVVNGFVVAITVTDGGVGYTSLPSVTISGGGGSGAGAVASVTANGVVDKIIVKDAGSDYADSPVVTISPPPTPDTFSAGLLAYYPFTGNANDQSGNHYDGTVVGAELAPDRFGVPERAYHFSRPASYIQVPIDFKNSQKVTVSAWIKLDANESAQGFFTRDDFERGISLWYSPSGYFQFTVGANRGFVGASYSTTPTLGRWYFLTGTYDGTAIKLFLDGAEVASTDYGDGISYLATGMNWIGNDSLNPASMLRGAIDEVRVYSRALSEDEIAALHALEAPDTPFLSVEVKQVRLNMFVKPGKTYQLEASTNLVDWTTNGPAFVAPVPTLSQDFDVTSGGRYFRIFEVQP